MSTTTIRKLCLLVSSMLVSAALTHKLASLDGLAPGDFYTGIRHSEASLVRASCCPTRPPDSITQPVSILPPGFPEPAPAASTDIWTRIRDGFELPRVTADTVRKQVAEYTRHPHLLKQILRRGEPYLFHILNRLEQNGMPTELALLPVIESAFDPFATSPAGAAGIWQFMPDTATHVGLRQDWWYDGRRDFIASTEAALRYLERLNKRFHGDWLLALAAYNAGSARVQMAIRQNRESGRPADFWHLSLPAETQSYVPRLIALKRIIASPDNYNVSLPRLPDARQFSNIEVQGQLDLRVAARLAGISFSRLQRLNPCYDRSITPPGMANNLLVPGSVAQTLRERIARLPEDRRMESIRYRIREGDNLSTIAQNFRTTVNELRKLNRLHDNRIFAGDLLIIPPPGTDTIVADSGYSDLI